MRTALLLCLALAGCRDAPRVVVVGGGLAGMSAALEAASTGGVDVVLLEGGEQLGGSAWYSPVLTALPTAEQWPGDEPAQVRYRDQAADAVAWLEGMSIPWMDLSLSDRFGVGGAKLIAPIGGGRRVVERLGAHLAQAGVEIVLGAKVTDVSADLAVEAGGRRWESAAVILATGGWAGDLPGVRGRLGLPADAPLLRGVPAAADGNGLALAAGLGGRERAPAAAQLYADAVPDPSDPALALLLPRLAGLLLVDTRGGPAPWLGAPSPDNGARLLQLPGAQAWAVASDAQLAALQLTDLAAERSVPAADVAQAHGKVASDLAELATSLAAPALAGAPLPPASGYGAVPVRARTAWSLTGLETDLDGRVLTAEGAPIPGLYAAGELAGFGHPYGESAPESTQALGAILSGRAAGRAAAAHAAR